MSGQGKSDIKNQGRFYIKSCERDVYFVYDPSFDLFEFCSGSLSKENTLGYAYGKLLESLVCCAGDVVSREQIFFVAWPDRVVTQNSLNQAIFYLRQLFRDVDGRVIKTIPRRGYMFNPDYFLSNSDSVVDALEQSLNELNKKTVDISPFVDMQEESHKVVGGSKTSPDSSMPSSILPLSKNPASQIFSFKYGIMFMLLMLLFVLVYRLYYLWDEKTWFDSKLVVDAEQSVLFVGSDSAEVEAIQLATEVLRQRFMALNHDKSYLVFNKMHDYLDIVCVNPKNQAKFILVHETIVKSISDEQISECLK